MPKPTTTTTTKPETERAARMREIGEDVRVIVEFHKKETNEAEMCICIHRAGQYIQLTTKPASRELICDVSIAVDGVYRSVEWFVDIAQDELAAMGFASKWDADEERLVVTIA